MNYTPIVPAPHMRFLVCAQRDWDGYDPYWIMSPNVDFIREQPNYAEYVKVMSDGRLGIHEWVHHPRNFVRFRAHEAVINLDPCDADLCFLMSNVSRDDLVWDSIRPLGRFSLGVRIRIDTTFRRVASIINEQWSRAVDPSCLPHDSKLHATVAYFFMMQRVHTWENAITVFRHWQRCCRDLVAWHEWQLLVDAMHDRKVAAPAPNLKYRGVYTRDPLVVKLYAVLGVPVWYISRMQKMPPLKRLVRIVPWQESTEASTCQMTRSTWKAPDLFKAFFHHKGGLNIPYAPVKDMHDFEIGVEAIDDANKPPKMIRIGRSVLAGANFDLLPPISDERSPMLRYDWSGLDQHQPKPDVTHDVDNGVPDTILGTKRPLSTAPSVSIQVVEKRRRVSDIPGSTSSSYSMFSVFLYRYAV